MSRQRDHRRQRDRRALIITGVALVAILVIAADLLLHARRPDGSVRALVAGYRRSHIPDAEALADEKLTGDESDAGYRWAESHGLDSVAGCPDYTVRFRQGCADYAKEVEP